MSPIGEGAGKATQSSEVDAADYRFLQQFLMDSCGIVLGESKHYLVKNRLASIMREFDLPSISDLVAQLQRAHPATLRLKNRVIDAMTTNETFWFRDEAQFDELKNTVLPDLLNRKPSTLRIWSAACSSGQEPYSISICVEELAVRKGSLPNRPVQIIGTDISETMLAEAERAVYTSSALARGLTPELKQRYFHSAAEGFQLNKAITQRVKFQNFNLLNPFTILGRFDIIFCRNVLIYFSNEIKTDILQRMAQVLENGGYLFLSSTETLPAGVSGFELVRGSHARYYRKI